jgi:mRNA interferase YafQ
MARRGKSIVKIINVIVSLMNETLLPPNQEDHPLKGDLEGFRDCHIEPDWLLIYEIHDKTLYLSRTGTHDDLFK